MIFATLYAAIKVDVFLKGDYEIYFWQCFVAPDYAIRYGELVGAAYSVGHVYCVLDNLFIQIHHESH